MILYIVQFSILGHNPLHLKSACSLEETEEKVVKLRLYMANVAQYLFGIKVISVTSHSHSYPSPPATLPGPSSETGEGWSKHSKSLARLTKRNG